jgi:hypothetical protein
VRFTTDFTSEKISSAWTRRGSRIDLPHGQYQIRVAAAGADQSSGSVFTEVSVPNFNAALGVGGLSLGAHTAIPIPDADRLRGVLALIPFATNEIARGTSVAAQLPIRVSAKSAAIPLTITATLAHPDGMTHQLETTQGAARDYARAGGKVYRIALPPELTVGRYRLVIETTLGGTTIIREIPFFVLAQR